MQTLFTSDRMIVKGVQYNGPTEEGKTYDRFIELEFIFQVNGKITQFSMDMELEGDGLSLKDWHEWNAVCKLFFSMGYKFEEGLYENPGIIRGWLLEANRGR